MLQIIAINKNQAKNYTFGVPQRLQSAHISFGLFILGNQTIFFSNLFIVKCTIH